MLTMSKQELNLLLTTYEGREVVEPHKRDTIPFYANNKKLSNMREHKTVTLDITEITANYNQHYRHKKDATFASFVQWLSIKSLQEGPLSYRLINNECYQFANLPLERWLVVGKQREPYVSYFSDVTRSQWKKFNDRAVLKRQSSLFDITPTSNVDFDACSHHLIDLGAKRITSFSAAGSRFNSHRPTITIGAPYRKDDRNYITLSFIFSPDICTPDAIQDFCVRFLEYGKLIPEYLQRKHLKTDIDIPQNSKTLLSSYQLKSASLNQTQSTVEQDCNELNERLKRAKL